MELALLIDIGSTYTKATVIDLDRLEIRAKANSLTTVEEDLTLGIKNTFEKLKEQGIDLDSIKYRLACSSAAGGLKMMAIGLVPELTAEAAKRAALGAGAKVEGVYSYELSQNELDEIIEAKPDLILLAGGTDGGNQDIILKNAQKIADSKLASPIIVAGNKVARAKIEDILKEKEVYLSENVMPKLEELNIEPARKMIRKIFLDKIIYAKGLSKAKEYVDNLIMPTPSAVMKAARLIAQGSSEEEGLGELLVVDIGGATTDIHSAAKGNPTKGGVSLKGLEEPFLKRTVEGDLGMRYSASSLLEAIDQRELLAYLCDKDKKDEFINYINKIKEKVDYIPKDGLEKSFDIIIAKIATKLAMQRHVGRIETVYSPFGQGYAQYGKDLTDLDLIIATGGVLVHGDKQEEILKEGLFDEDNATILTPIKPKLMVDREYILSTIGLLATLDSNKALKLAKKYLEKVDYIN